MGYSCNIALVLVVSISILHVAHAQDAGAGAGAGATGNSPDDYLNAHSCIRRVMDLPPLSWDEKLAKDAQAYADQRKDCKMIHSDKCGESMAAGQALNGSYAVQMWLDEKRNYDYGENKCVKDMCGHYTQIIWKNTTKLGCGSSKCSDGGLIVVCRYDPPGNIAGEKPF